MDKKLPLAALAYAALALSRPAPALAWPDPSARHQRPSTARERAQTPLPADADRVVHLIRPRETDPEIRVFLKDHYAMRYKSVPKNGRLLVFFPGTSAQPRVYQRLMSQAASRGYLVLGLEYPNATERREKSSVAALCAGARDVRCSELVRRSRLFGERAWPSIDVSEADSILNRLEKALGYLARKYPGEGWDAFWDGKELAWERLVLAGHSQGAGYAAYLAKQHEVARVALFSGPAERTAPWILAPSRTPASRYYAAVHADEKGYSTLLENYRALGIRSASQLLTLDLKPNDVRSFSGAAHGSVATDAATPLAADGRPLYRPAWDALLGE